LRLRFSSLFQHLGGTDAGHFALDQKTDEIARLTKAFLDRQKR
jgi:hypothetical protein